MNYKLIVFTCVLAVLQSQAIGSLTALAEGNGGDGGGTFGRLKDGPSTPAEAKDWHTINESLTTPVVDFLGKMFNAGVKNTQDFGTWEGGQSKDATAGHDSFSQNGPAGTAGNPRSGYA